jgi:DNA-binding CsgD family transcriptional regulator
VVRGTKDQAIDLSEVSRLLERFPHAVIVVFDIELLRLVETGTGIADLGLKFEDILGKTLKEFMQPPGVGEPEPPSRRAFAGESPQLDELASGTRFAVAVMPFQRLGEKVETILVLANGVPGGPDASPGPVISLAPVALASPTAKMAGRYRLTSRELEVLGLVALGLANKEIAVRLHCSIYTVERHVTHILAKMSAPSRTAASVMALNEGLL